MRRFLLRLVLGCFCIQRRIVLLSADGDLGIFYQKIKCLLHQCRIVHHLLIDVVILKHRLQALVAVAFRQCFLVRIVDRDIFLLRNLISNEGLFRHFLGFLADLLLEAVLIASNHARIGRQIDAVGG